MPRAKADTTMSRSISAGRAPDDDHGNDRRTESLQGTEGTASVQSRERESAKEKRGGRRRRRRLRIPLPTLACRAMAEALVSRVQSLSRDRSDP